jgi:hypothetical protein
MILQANEFINGSLFSGPADIPTYKTLSLSNDLIKPSFTPECFCCYYYCYLLLLISKDFKKRKKDLKIRM